jgi:Tfp pilus assembly protein PilV
MDSPSYLIKSRSGETLIQGTAEQVSAWLKEKRITDKDELKRIGWHVYEKDEAWAALEAFPELIGPSAHAQLHEKRKHNWWILAAAGFVGLLGLILILTNQLLPAYDASQRIAASAESEHQAMAAKLKAEADAKDATEQAGKAKEAMAKAENNLREQLRRTEIFQAEVAKLNIRIDQIKKTMPIVVRWRESLINNDQVLMVTNTSDKATKLLVSIYDADGVQTNKQFPMTLAPAGLPGSTKESGVGETVKHYFKNGESAEFTDVDTGKDFRYTPVKYTFL